MATAIRTDEIKGAFYEHCAWPTRESMEGAVRTARRAVAAARNKTEDVVAGTALEVRRHPLAAVGLAGVAGLMAGVALGAAGTWLWSNRA